MRLSVLLALALCLAVPTLARAQAGACQLIDSQSLDRQVTGGFQTIYIIAPIVHCTGGARITANEGTLFEASREILMVGSVSFVDAERRLNSDRATYASVTGRLYATGNVVFTDLVEGMVLRGPELEYYRAMPNRPQAQAIATQRPHLTLLPRQREGADRPADAEPVEIDAERMTMTGNEHYTAIGRVEIRRSDFDAFSHVAELDQANERMELQGEARIRSDDFDLTGAAIDLFLPDDALERVHARGDAVLVGEDLRIDSPDLQLFFADDQLQRMVARSMEEATARSIASAREFRLEADSIDALMPEQQLDRVIAIGDARGESLDTTAAPAGRLAAPAPAGSLTDGERDWITGDTVTAYFAAVEPAAETVADGASSDESRRREVELTRLVSQGAARSLYRVQNDGDQGRSRPGLNYLVGDTIELSFSEGELSVADVRGLQRGLYLDPQEQAVPTPEADQPEQLPAPAEAEDSPLPGRR